MVSIHIYVMSALSIVDEVVDRVFVLGEKERNFVLVSGIYTHKYPERIYSKAKSSKSKN